MARESVFGLPLLALLMGAALTFIFHTSGAENFRAGAHFLPPPANVEHFSLGYSEVVSDLLWLRLIQDIDHCESTKASPSPLKVNVADGAKCEPTKFGWAFQMLDAITRLTPKFKIPYIQGGAMLSVVVRDGEGAARIFDRGIENFPTYWPLQYAAAYHQMSELRDNKRAAELLIMAGKNGAPGWVYSLASHLYTQLGQAMFAKSILEKMIEEDPESRWAGKLKERLKEAEETIARERSKGSPAPASTGP